MLGRLVYIGYHGIMPLNKLCQIFPIDIKVLNTNVKFPLNCFQSLFKLILRQRLC